MADNKTERATPRRRQKARERGQVVRSRDLIASLATMAAILILCSQMKLFPSAWRDLLRDNLNAACAGDHFRFSWARGVLIFRGVAITAILTWLCATLAAVAQGGVIFVPSSLAPNVSRISPASRMQQLCSISSVSRLLKSLLPAAVIAYLAVLVIARDWRFLPSLLSRTILGFSNLLTEEAFQIAWKSAFVLLVWSGVDYLLERRKFESELRMSRQEIIDEFKETEGNPTVKARIRRLQRQVRRRRMLKDVERAAVVITNPTEFAIALEFSPMMAAPVVVAKGRNLLAAEIKQVARWRGIPLVENPPLAHALYRAVEIGQSIPPKLYQVVAEVLAAIYRVQEQVAGKPSEEPSWRQ